MEVNKEEMTTAYMKRTKKELVEMLINNIEELTKVTAERDELAEFKENATNRIYGRGISDAIIITHRG